MTGAERCRRFIESEGLACEVVPALANQYIPGERTISLTPHHYGGTSARNLTVAAHECGHAEQHARWGALVPVALWLCLGNLWLEWDASRRARALLARRGLLADRSVLAASWRGYLWPAVGQTLAMLALAVGAVMLRR